MTIGLVIIGRNEGARLQRCIGSALGQADRIVYVDSGSTDGSPDWVRAQGVDVVDLDPAQPMSAARGRNAGFDHLSAQGPLDLVQFVDGDCTLAPGWIAAGAAFLDRWPTVGLVTGWRAEVAPGGSLYNRLADVEWHRPAGQIAACGGDMMVRAAVWRQVGGMAPDLICSEDEDLVIRARQTGLTAHRIGLPMTAHDADIHRFGPFWRRAVRAGHGFAAVGRPHPSHFVAERRWDLWVPLVTLALLPFAPVWALGLFVGFNLLGWLGTVRWLMAEGLDLPQATQGGTVTYLSRVAHLIGMGTFWQRHLAGRRMEIIEYK
jgi:glycosyltransferase involved in cell wall biosynthesis